jgi:pilus assembly protein CpaF
MRGCRTARASRQFSPPAPSRERRWRYSPKELVAFGTLPADLLAYLARAVQDHQNILISGGTGSGKTTLLGALASFIPPRERIIIIEDTSEISLQAQNVVRLEARREQAPIPAVTIRDLLKTSLRLRPDRILLGEVRSGEAFDLLQALNTGHAGTLSTLHATSAAQALARFTTCVLLAGIDLPYKAVRSNIGEALHMVVHIARYLDQRRVLQACLVKAYDGERDRFELESIYEWSKPHGP